MKIFNTIIAAIVDNLEDLFSCPLKFLGFFQQMTSDALIRGNPKSCCLLVSLFTWSLLTFTVLSLLSS